MKEVIIYTDGGCRNNGKKNAIGGYGIVMIYNEHIKTFKKGFENVTNNIMELTAVIDALSFLKEPCKVKLYCDSAYIVNAVNKGWLNKWQRNNWRTIENTLVKNKELWIKLIDLLKIHTVTFIKVKGHSNNKYNNMCDELAKDAILDLEYEIFVRENPYIDYSNKSVECLADKVPNFTKGKLYEIVSTSINLRKQPSGFVVYDDYGYKTSIDYILSKKNKFNLINDRSRPLL